VPQFSRAGRHDERRRHVGNELGDGLDQLVREQGLAGRDEDGAGDGLEEDHDGGDGGDVSGLDDGLGDDYGDLDCETDSDAGEGLVADPV
jgi:hypothetical protein